MHTGRADWRPEPLPLGVWTWMPRVWRVTQTDVVRMAGMDAATHLRILAFGACTQKECIIFHASK